MTRPSQTTLPANSSDLPNLDALRALAVLLVFSDHALETVGALHGYDFQPYAWYFGRLGVVLFFVHTCYVLMASLRRLPGTGWTLTRTFLVRRAFRIYPLAILSILLVMLLQAPPLPWLTFQAPSTGDLVSNLTLTMNLTGSDLVLQPLWSLPIEVQMYLLLPAIYLVTRQVTDLRWVAGLWLTSLLAAYFIAPLSGRFSVATFAPCFMSGVVAFALRDRIAARLPAALWPLLLLVMTGVYVAIEQVTPGIHHVALQSGICLALGFLIPLFRQTTSRWFNRTTHYVARYSYGIYLFHCIALWLGFHGIAPESDVLKGLVALGLIVVMSVCSYHWIEAPLMRLGARLSKPRVSSDCASEVRSPLRDTP